MKNKSLPSFTSSAEWVSYQQLLINRLTYLKTMYGGAVTPLKASISAEENKSLTVNAYLKMLAEWMDAYGVSLDWLLKVDNSSCAVMKQEKTLSAKVQLELSIICERFLNILEHTRSSH